MDRSSERQAAGYQRFGTVAQHMEYATKASYGASLPKRVSSQPVLYGLHLAAYGAARICSPPCSACKATVERSYQRERSEKNTGLVRRQWTEDRPTRVPTLEERHERPLQRKRDLSFDLQMLRDGHLLQHATLQAKKPIRCPVAMRLHPLPRFRAV